MVRMVVFSLAALLSAVTAQSYGAYGPYGGFDVQPDAPEPVGTFIVMPFADEPEGAAIVMPSGEESDLPGCMIDHGLGCEQCLPGFYKVGSAAVPMCEECTQSGCLFCNDFVGCGQCEEGFFFVIDEDN